MGSANYEEPTLNTLPERTLAVAESIPHSIREISESLGSVTYVSKRNASDCIDLKASEIESLLHKACQDGDIVVLYWTGHGVLLESGRYILATKDYKKADLPRSGIKPELLPELMVRRNDGEVDSSQPPTLVILDCCFSQNAGIEILRSALTYNEHPNLWVMATAGETEYAQSGAFASALSSLIRDPKIGHLMPMVPFDVVLERCRAALSSDQRVYLFPPASGVSEFPPFFPNLRYVEGARGQTVAEIDQHWIAKANGAPAGTFSSGWYVTGRTGRVRAVEEISKWIAGKEQQGLLAIVTGSPGTGKSTVLALPVLLSKPQSRQNLLETCSADSPARTAEVYISTKTRIISVHARGLNADQVAAQIASGLRIKAFTVGELLDHFHNHPTRWYAVIIVDAVDEAADPLQLRDELLLPMTRHYGLRLVLGARPNVVEGVSADLRIDLNAQEHHDPEAVVEYVSQLLMATHEPELHPAPPYRSASGIPDEQTVKIARAIASYATSSDGVESFLIAQVIARAVRSRPDRLNVDSSNWESQLPSSFNEAFEEELRGLGDKQYVALILLEALAWAKGPGLPWENVWLSVAQAIQRLHPQSERRVTVSDLDIRWLLSKDGALNRAGAYIIEDLGPGNRSVFRPFHDRLTDHLRQRLLDSMRGGRSGQSLADKWLRIESLITDALMSTLVLPNANSADWALAHPYIRTYLAEHASGAGQEKFFSIVKQNGFLAVADPTTLTPLLSPTSILASSSARIYRRARPLLGDNPNENAAYLCEAGLATGNTLETGQEGIRPTYSTLSAFILRDEALLTLTGVGRLRALNAITANDGRTVLIACNENGVVQTSDPQTGSPAGQGLKIPEEVHPILGAAVGQCGNGDVLLAASDGKRNVRVWDVRAGAFVANFGGHARAIREMAFVQIGSLDSILVCADGDVLRLWDPSSGLQLGPSLSADFNKISTIVSKALPGNCVLLAAGADDGSVTLWRCTQLDLSKFIANRANRVAGKSSASPTFKHYRSLTTQGSAVTSLSFDVQDGSHVRLAVGLGNGAVYLWDVKSGKATSILTLDSGDPALVALCSSQDGDPTLVVNGPDNKIEVLDPTTGGRLRDPQGGHSGKIEHIVFECLDDGEPVLATASRDGTVRIWDVGDVDAEMKAAVTAPGPATAVGAAVSEGGSLLLAYMCKGEPEVHLWDATANEPVGASFRPASWQKVVNLGFGRTEKSLAVLVGARGGMVRAHSLDGTVSGDGHDFTEENPTAFTFGYFGADPVVVAGRDPRRVSMWNFESGDRIKDPIVIARPGNEAVRTITALAIDGESATDTVIAVAHSNPTRSVGVVRHAAAIDIRVVGPKPSIRLCESNGRINALAMFRTASDRRYLVEGGDGCEVHVWDVADLKCVATIRRRSAVRSLAATGRFLVIGDDEGVAAVELDLGVLGLGGR
ncbi:WD40 repeat domain-containing protein [Mycobacterium sp. URHB0044]|uniref:WD40 repeat domain-containing protein n=1 Tax=Mycobacterium sp. URHB0044 TaxID=1380386 RepID=UPI0012DFA39F|nr:WD40 repeat domain-containing protein [Mycobacterium sp. URHB0044]